MNFAFSDAHVESAKGFRYRLLSGINRPKLDGKRLRARLEHNAALDRIKNGCTERASAR